jgi:hypothetical protein
MNIDILHIFSANSANDHNYKHLWLKGASLFIPQINELLKYTNYEFQIINIEEFINEKSNILGQIFEYNKSDKSTYHNYHILYSYIFNKLDTNKNLNIFEVGLGTNNPDLLSTMNINGNIIGSPGASLFSFRDYLPNSNIYGADIDKYILFECDRIKTCYIDQLDINTFDNIKTNFGDIKYDLIIDDGLHSIGANLNTLLFALNNINDNGWIVIEDIIQIDNWRSIDFILKSSNKFKTYIIKSKNDTFLYVINKL